MKFLLLVALVALALVGVAAGPNVVKAHRAAKGALHPVAAPIVTSVAPVAPVAAVPEEAVPVTDEAFAFDTRPTAADANPTIAPVYELDLVKLDDIAAAERDQPAAIAFAAQHQAFADEEARQKALEAAAAPAAPNAAPIADSAPVANGAPAPHALMEVSAPADKFIALAKSKVGSRYVYGAAGPTSFDCSGLVNWAAKAAGVTVAIGRTADQLYHNGKAITTTAARLPGDLIFFGKPGHPAYHVGIYLGNGMMIDAPHTGAFVRVEAYKYWPDQLTTARRIF